MVSISEELKDLKVHVLKWNEKLHNIEESNGLFMFRINDASKKSTQIEHGGFVRMSLFLFELVSLSTPDSTEYLVSLAIEGMQFFSEDTATTLRREVSAYLLSCFKFDLEIETLHQKPTIVIVVDVYISRTTISYTRKRFAPSPFPCRKQVKKQKLVDDDDDDDNGDWKGLKRSSEYSPVKFSVEEVQEIRGMLMSILEEPILMWVKPISSHERKGLREVEAAMNVKEFDGDDDEAVDDCPICLEGICGGMMVATTPCSHRFHRDCLFKWLPKTNRCPFCRSFCATLV